MNTSQPPAPDGRGTVWVTGQFLLMMAWLVAGPLWRAQWSLLPALLPGCLLLVAGAWVGMRGARDLGRQRTPFPKPVTGGALITTGIYSRMRHPLYAALMALGFAWALLWRSGPAWWLALVQVLFLGLKARQEERWLKRQFPEYADYARRVKSFVPGLY